MQYHLPPTATPEDVVDALNQDGFVIVDNLVPASTMDDLNEELAEYVDLTPPGRDDFTGRRTRRTGSLIPRSLTARGLIQNPLVLGAASRFLAHASAYQLHLTQVISVFPGETDQPLHRDELAWDFFPFPLDYNVQCNTIWAMTDFTAENGATRLVPGSHRTTGTVASQTFTEADIVRAEMEKGSMFFYTGKVIHGAGANNSTMIRQGVNLTYAVGWVRQEENQYLSTPIEVAKTLDDDLLGLMGYRMGGIAMGYIRDFEDPMVAIRDTGAKQQFDFASYAQSDGTHASTKDMSVFSTDMEIAETPESPFAETLEVAS